MRLTRTIVPRQSIALALTLLAACSAPEPAPEAIDRILVEKAERRLTLYSGGTPVRSFPIALGGDPIGHKREEGDERTPEGLYVVHRRKGDSAFHRALEISYPDATDRATAEAFGVDPGGLIMIHGIRNGLGWIGRLHRLVDWTDGCIAVTNAEMDQIWMSVKLETPVEIRP